MKISLNWIKQFTDVNLSIDELLDKIGTQLGAVEEVIDLGGTYQHVVIAEVISCVKHPNADKLNVCKIDDGGTAPDVERDTDGLVQVVCGAPNIREGLKVAWIPPGATVPSTLDDDPFVLGSRELRGVISNGMIASAKELAIGDEHNGIAELDTEVEPGTSFADAYELNDYIIDIENKMFTHRPDCFGILGVAREIAGIQGLAFKSPEWYLQNSLDDIKISSSNIQIEIRNEADKFVPRLMAVAINNVKVAPSSFMMKTFLARVGLKPINNIVDITNYIMYLTGQPLHAYDADKLRMVSGSKESINIGTRMSRKGDKVNLLNGKTLELRDDSTVLIVSNDIPVGVGGVMGGADTEVDENTKNLVLECASFDMYSIRRTSMKYGLFTDAVTRFNKGQSPLQNPAVTSQALALFQYMAGGEISSKIVDVYQPELMENTVHVHTGSNYINSRLGLNLSQEEISSLLRNVEFGVEAQSESLVVTPPFWRTDIEIPEDVVEEVGRLYGYHKLQVVLPRRSILPANRDKILNLKSSIREILSSAGANEVLTYSFVHGDLLQKVGQRLDDAYKIGNALSPDLQYYRTSLTPSLLEKVHRNIKAGYDKFAIFEIGKSHIKNQMDRNDSDVPMEFNSVSLVFVANQKSAKDHRGAAFYQAVKYLDSLASAFNVKISREPFSDEVIRNNPALAHAVAPFEKSRCAIIRGSNGVAFGVIGEYKPSVRKSLKLPEFSAGFEIGLGALLSTTTSNYRKLSRFPSISQDLSLKVDSSISFQQIKDILANGISKLADQGMVVDMEPLDIYEKNVEKHFTFRFTVSHYEKTLRASEVNSLLDGLADIANEKLKAKRI